MQHYTGSDNKINLLINTTTLIFLTKTRLAYFIANTKTCENKKINENIPHDAHLPYKRYD